jgi:allantoicase
VVIDTSYFTGNYPERASLDACAVAGTPPAAWLAGDEAPWEPLLPETALEGNAPNVIAVDGGARRVTHLRLYIFPDGGVARLRVHGEVAPDERVFRPGREVDLAAIEHGGRVVSCSDMHYGDPQRLIYPGRSTHMGDGWETKRRRGPGHDWTIVRLARRGVVERVELDTDHFRGNAPGSCTLEWADAGDALDPGDAPWHELVPRTPLEPHARHRFDDLTPPPATHVRLNIYPDGGVARLRLFGRGA